MLRKGTFYFRHLAGELRSEEISDLKDFALTCVYPTEAVIFCAIDEDMLDCIPDYDRSRVVNTLTKTIGPPKLQHKLSGLRKQHIGGSLTYASMKVRLRLHSMLYKLRV